MKINPLKWRLHWQIILSLTLSFISGVYLLPNLDATFVDTWIYLSSFVGELFMNALKMMIIPLIVTSMISGVMQLGSHSGIGSIGTKTLLYYTFSGLCAVLIGLILVNGLQPGKIEKETALAMLGEAANTTSENQLFEKVDNRGTNDLLDIFKRMLPTNIFKAASDNGQLLGIIVFSIFYGFFAGRLPDTMKTFQLQFWETSQSIILNITEFIIRFAPIGVYGLVLPIVFNAPIGDLIQTLYWFFITVLLGLFIHMFIALSLCLKLFTKVNPITHYKTMFPVILTAFSTASSSATLPLTIDTVSQKANVSKKTCAFTLPLGATINMDGTALYECIVVLFIAQLYASIGGVDLTLGQQCLVVFLALTTSIGVAGIPAASLVAIAIILPAVGLPIEAIGVVWVTDRLLDMCRTSVNVFSDTVAAIVIAHSEGEEPYAQVAQKD